MELSIDTSTRYASVGLSRSGESIADLTWRSARNHSVELAPAMRELMGRFEVGMSDIEAVFVAKGPGGFSALRVGMSLAKALASALEVPLVSVATLDIEAQPHLGLGIPVVTVVEAGRSRCYVGRHGQSGAPSYDVVSTDDVAVGIESTTLFCGEGIRAVAEILQRRLGGLALITDVAPPTRHATVLAQLAYRRWQSGHVDDTTMLQPIYLRSAQVTKGRQPWATARPPQPQGVD